MLSKGLLMFLWIFDFFEEMCAVAEPPIIARRRKFTGRMSTPITEKGAQAWKLAKLAELPNIVT